LSEDQRGYYLERRYPAFWKKLGARDVASRAAERKERCRRLVLTLPAEAVIWIFKSALNDMVGTS